MRFFTFVYPFLSGLSVKLAEELLISSSCLYQVPVNQSVNTPNTSIHTNELPGCKSAI